MGIKFTDKDYHKINKKTYEMKLQLDSRGYYSSRLGVNMYLLKTGEYTFVYEFYYSTIAPFYHIRAKQRAKYATLLHCRTGQKYGLKS